MKAAKRIGYISAGSFCIGKQKEHDQQMETNTFFETYTKHLNQKQMEAVQAIEGPVLLLAVPGSGKTTVLVNRLGYMIYCKGIQPEEILTLTYTVAATKDMSKRFVSIFGNEVYERLEFRTINGICAKVIQRYAGMIGKPAFELVTDEGQLIRILAGILKDKLEEYPTESELKSYKTWITYCKNMMLNPEEIKAIGEREGIPLEETYREYNGYLRGHQWMDYDDQMIYGYNLLKKSPQLLEYYQSQYRYICVDEAQDTSKIQHAIIRLLAGKSDNLFMVGDEDQSIYGFRAAYPEALLNFEKEHPGACVLVMDQNYRSNAKIVAAADSFIRHNKARHDKHMKAVCDAGEDIRYIELKNRRGQYAYLARVAADCNVETAVLYRDNESALPLIDLLDRQQITFRLKSVDMNFFTNRVVTDITSILRFALNPYDTELFMRIYFICQTYLKKYQAEQMCRVSQEEHIPVLEAADKIDSLNGMIRGKCRGVATNLRSMRQETPSKALFRIENPMGYLEYLQRNDIDEGKLFILKQLAYPENTIKSYLDRLEYLRESLKKGSQGYDEKFILSTIHSSKGLEYDRVYLMDVVDGLFPAQIPLQGATEDEMKAFEEERRLFYVGMTRAKRELIIFRQEGESSRFLREMTETPKDSEKKQVKAAVSESADNEKLFTNVDPSRLKSDFILTIGERVVQLTYGAGVVEDVEYNDKGQATRFVVAFDDGSNRTFGFPLAFRNGTMRLESGEKVEISVEEKPVVQVKQLPRRTAAGRKKYGKESYAYWAENYPDYVVIKREGAFWSCRGESARIISRIMGYRLNENSASPFTGSPNLDAMVTGLNRNGENYIVVEDGEIIDQGDF